MLLYSQDWSLLGPFQIGTREGPWGSDTLEFFGGFHTISRDDAENFPSSLTPKGRAKWSNVTCDIVSSDKDCTSANLTANFNDVDWKKMQNVYGWAALQYQAWVRGTIFHKAESSEQVSVSIDNVLEFWVDDRRYFGGNFLAFRPRSPIFLDLSPGYHVLELRLIRDVRSMGALTNPSVTVHIDIKIHEAPLYVHPERHHIPDIVVLRNGQLRLSSAFFSIFVSNTTKDDLEISHLSSISPLFDIVHNARTQVKLAAGQTRPLTFLTVMVEQHNPQQVDIEAQFVIHFTESIPGKGVSTAMFSHTFNLKSVESFHKFTYLHHGVVAYSMLRAPRRPPSPRPKASPVMVCLHGAGVDADSDQAIHALDGTEDLDAWLLISEPGNTWGIDDFHQIGVAGVKAGVAAIQGWIENIGDSIYGVFLDSVMVIGHSNGGQGVWYLATHWPDFVFAIAVVSGYNSIQAYVPFQFWREASPYKRAVVEGVLSDFRHELLVPNVADIPLLQQHGADDDNVPVYHGRRMAELLRQTNASSRYSELTGGHWFDGIMTTEGLKSFYHAHLSNAKTNRKSLTDFEFVVANPRSTGPKNGITVEELIVPGHLGVVHVRFSSATSVNIFTENIKRFSFSDKWVEIESAVIDTDQPRNLRQANSFPIFLEKVDRAKWMKIAKRDAFHLGGLHAILQSESNLVMIVNQDATTLHISQQIARNMLQYFAMDAEIVQSYKDAARRDCNIVTVMTGAAETLLASAVDHPITIPNARAISIKDYDGNNRSYFAQNLGLGSVFLRSLAQSRLELVVWGSDLESLCVASRLVPTTTGIGQPDFAILDKSVMWKGLEGVLALGFFDSRWKPAVTSWFS